MQALYLTNNTVELRELPRPSRPAGESLIRLRLAGICNTDLELKRGYMAYEGVPGHEFVGEVVESDDAALVGRRVVGEINAGCGECAYCRCGLERHCPERTTLGIFNRAGAHAEYLTLPTRNLHLVPDTVPDEHAVFTEPLAAACEILEQVHVEPAHHVVVVGDGKLGLLIAQVLALTGCELHVIGRHQEKLAILAELGIPTEVVGRGETTTLPARWADVAVEATGNPSGFAAARHVLRPRGILVLKSTYHGTPEVDLTGVVVDEITVVGSRCGPFRPALRLLAQGQIDVAGLLHGRFPLREGPAAYARAAEPGVLKVLLFT